MVSFSFINKMSGRRGTRSRNNSVTEIWEVDSKKDSMEDDYCTSEVRPLRKRGSALFSRRAKPEDLSSDKTRSASRLNEVMTVEKEPVLMTLASRIKGQRMRKASQSSLRPTTIVDTNTPAIVPSLVSLNKPSLHHARSTPSLYLAASHGTDSRVFFHGKPIGQPLKFRHVSHADTDDFSHLHQSNKSELEQDWRRVTHESRRPYTPRPQTSSRSTIYTDSSPLPSPAFSHEESMINSLDLSRSSTRSIEVTGTVLHPHMIPPPRTSSRLACSAHEAIVCEEPTPIIIETPEPDAEDIFQSHFNPTSPIQEDYEDVDELRPATATSFMSNSTTLHSTSRPHTSSRPSTSHSTHLFRSFQVPHRPVLDRLVVPQQQHRPVSQISDTLGLGCADASFAEESFEINNQKRISKLTIRRCRTPMLNDEFDTDITSWEDDIDWSYDNENEAQEVEAVEAVQSFRGHVRYGSKSAPVSAFPSAVNLTTIHQDRPLLQRESSDHSFLLSDDEDSNNSNKSITRQNSNPSHRKQVSSSSARSLGVQLLASHASLPDLQSRRRHYHRREASLHISTSQEFHPSSKQRYRHSGAREVALPPASYINTPTRSRSTSSATCVTLVSDTDTGVPSDTEARTPGHSSHNSAESGFLLRHAGSFTGKNGYNVDAHRSEFPGLVYVGIDGTTATTPSIMEVEPFNFF